jgi:hypothetical protein
LNEIGCKSVRAGKDVNIDWHDFYVAGIHPFDEFPVVKVLIPIFSYAYRLARPTLSINFRVALCQQVDMLLQN